VFVPLECLWLILVGKLHVMDTSHGSGISPHRPLITNKLFASALMSHPHLSAASFQLIFNNALNAYEKCTKIDLLTHPLIFELQACNSPAAILVVLHQKVQGLDQSQSSGDRRTKWLDPTVKVLYTLSATLEERVGLVSPKE
jgi:hypothetical protein